MAKKGLSNDIFIISVALMTIVALYLFWAAESTSTSYDSLIASDIKLDHQELSLTLDSSDSAHLFHSYSYEIENRILYLTVRHGPSRFHSSRWPVQIRIQDEALTSVHSVYLRDGKSSRLVCIST